MSARQDLQVLSVLFFKDACKLQSVMQDEAGSEAALTNAVATEIIALQGSDALCETWLKEIQLESRRSAN